MKIRPKLTTCDQRSARGACLSASRPGHVVHCPDARAESLKPGECTHHPGYDHRAQLAAMFEAGVLPANLNSSSVGGRLSDPAFVAKLHAAWQRKRLTLAT